MKIDQHWLLNAKRILSPNYDERPDENDISLIVIHCISLPPGEFGNNYIDDLFCNRLNPKYHVYFAEIYQLKVSAHILITRDGVIKQYVAFNQRAWHAGPSEYAGISRCNDYSIGIELEGTDSLPYTEAQYTKLADLIKTLLKYYPQLSRQRIAGHSDIAPGRKTDPGDFFDWSILQRLLRCSCS